MARYTDIDKVIAEYDRVHIGPAGGARKLMVQAPIADVVPRASEDEEIALRGRLIANAKVEVVREIIAKIKNAIDGINDYLHVDEYYGATVVLGRIETVLEGVEKKYTEGE